MVLPNSATAAKEGHQEDDNANDNEEHGHRDELVAQKVQVRGIQGLHHCSDDDQCDPRQLCKEIMSTRVIAMATENPLQLIHDSETRRGSWLNTKSNRIIAKSRLA